MKSLTELKSLNDVVNYICDFMIEQGEPCFEPNLDSGIKCKYRAGVKRCAAGCLIDDERYDERIEANGIEDFVFFPEPGSGAYVHELVEKSIGWAGDTESLTDLISEAQDLHDTVATDLNVGTANPYYYITERSSWKEMWEAFRAHNAL